MLWSGYVTCAETTHRATCRLPQTPRTPSVAAAHYFDEFFTRQRRPSKAPGGLRRSYTSRSIGVRSDWDPATNGEDDEALTRVNSVGYPSEESERRREEVDQHVANYITDQLQRRQSHDSIGSLEDELEAQVDGAM